MSTWQYSIVIILMLQREQEVALWWIPTWTMLFLPWTEFERQTHSMERDQWPVSNCQLPFPTRKSDCTTLRLVIYDFKHALLQHPLHLSKRRFEGDHTMDNSPCSWYNSSPPPSLPYHLERVRIDSPLAKDYSQSKLVSKERKYHAKSSKDKVGP